MKPSHLRAIRSVTDHQISPDGARVVYETTQVLGNGYRRDLSIVDLSTGEHTHIDCPGDARVPSFSPDGSRISFVRVDAGRHELCLIDPSDGAISVLAVSEERIGAAVSNRHLRGMSAPVWSPDGRRLAYIAEVPSRRGFSDESRVRRIRRREYRMDGRGYLVDSTMQVFLALADGTSAARRLSIADVDHWDVSWRPDGAAVVCVRRAENSAGLQLTELSLDGSERTLVDGEATAMLPTYDPHRSVVRFLGIHGLDRGAGRTRARNVSLLEVDLTTHVVRPLTDENVVDAEESRLRPLEPAASPIVTEIHRGRVGLIDPVGGGSPVLDGAFQVLGHDHRAGVSTVVLSTAISAGDLHVIRDGEPVALTTNGHGYADDVTIPEEILVPSPEGHDVHAWVYRPDAEGQAPLLLMVHGGPDTQFGHRLELDAQVLAARGYAVVLANPRGSAGYGQDFAMTINGRLGSVDADDLLLVVDHLRADPTIDGSRVGVFGRSYGGFMTAWLTNLRPDLFAVAIAECGVYSWDSLTGTSDIGRQFFEVVGDDRSAWIAQSPMTYASRVRAPTMIMAYSGDLRVPAEQAERYFAALLDHGVETELVIFEGGPHSFAESGPPASRIARLELLGEWFDRHLLSETPQRRSSRSTSTRSNRA